MLHGQKCQPRPARCFPKTRQRFPKVRQKFPQVEQRCKVLSKVGQRLGSILSWGVVGNQEFFHFNERKEQKRATSFRDHYFLGNYSIDLWLKGLEPMLCMRET